VATRREQPVAVGGEGRVVGCQIPGHRGKNSRQNALRTRCNLFAIHDLLFSISAFQHFSISAFQLSLAEVLTS
jgi:hypothetical protein